MGHPVSLRNAGLAALSVLSALSALLMAALPVLPLRAQSADAPSAVPPSAIAPSSMAPSLPFNEVRALNLARNTAVKLNGGLGGYRPASCMFGTEAAIAAGCLVNRDEQGFLFRFRGGPPGWEQLNLPATVETELRIAPDGRSLVNQIYNGPPR
jgi:hypothetical protein